MKTQEITIKPYMKVTLGANTEMLDEVMVVAFGTQKKSAFTGSATVINSEELSKKVTTNVIDALVGTTPGLQLRGSSGAPGAGQGSINIRGVSSMYAGTDPLIIVDGAPYSASLSNIPQGDIESVTILKDAASAALYGARGASGVILVTTKTGKNKKAQINVDVKYGGNSRSVQDYKTINDPGKYYETVYGEYYNYYYYGQGQSVTNANVNANATMLQHLAYNIYTVPNGQQLIGTDGKLNSSATLGRSYAANGETYYLTADNWRDAAYSTSFRQEYNVSMNGATDKGSFYASLGYLDENGIIEYSGYKRLSARVKADYQVKKWAKLGANIGYVNSTTDSNPNLDTSLSSSNLMYYTSRIAPIYPIYVRVLDENGNPKIRTDANGNPQYDYGVAASNYPGLTRTFLATGNPLGSNRYNDVTSKGSQLNGTFTLDLNFTKFLTFNATSTVNWGHTNASDYENALYGSKVSVNGQISKSQTDVLRQNHTQTLTYFNTFGQHNVNAMVGHEYYDTKTTYLYAYGQGLFTPDVKEIDAAANDQLSASSYTTEYNVEGYFGNLRYNYAEKYFASASYRRDASSRFAKANRWGNFWSVGGAWLINKEDFFQANWIDQLKLKLSIGQQGNDNIGNWAYTDLYSLTPASTSQMSASFSRMGNPDITWETTTNFNAGVEFNLFKNRLSGNVDYYTKKTTDLLFWLSIPESAGSRGYYGNIGDIRNSGVELSLQGSVIHTKDIDWSLQFNISHNSDKILKLPASKVTTLGGFTASSKWYKVGGHLYDYFLAEYAGVNAQGEATYWVDSDLAGATNRPGKNHSYTTTNPNNATKYEQGNSLPDAFGGFGTTFYAYGFDFSLTFDYQIGGHIYDNQYQALMSNNASASDAGSALHEDVLKSWTQNNTSSSIPRFQYGDQYTTASSSRWLTNAGYLNFQSFTVGYSLPQRILSNLGINKLRVYASGENLAFWSARRGLDPRYAYGENKSVNVYSPVRTVMGGIQLTF
ncbi:MAG: SusC/RagA family TonB-linked outer membrane protein [Bacteroides sp.]|jgi:TonB-linked SusC/RagA family outer membrane protein|nr:SusC/RagA family TonB-linked outer membrane protein [Bacteroides sp.]MCI1682531.1 SusC/RagA family TonB-linked outer membrane protein [Bacteroides sp.]